MPIINKNQKKLFHSLEEFSDRYDALKKPVLCAFDFDGTLVGFRKTPGAVELSQPARDILRKLNDRAEVAIVTGRGLKSIKKKMGSLRVHLAASHGFEIQDKRGKTLGGADQAWNAACRKWIQKTKEYMAEYPELRSCRIEDKKFSLTLHFRAVKDPVAAQTLYAKLISKVTPKARVVDGHLVVNVVPKIARHKGDAVRVLMKSTGSKSAVFIGDDVTDEDVFRLHLPHILTVRVGGTNEYTAADLHVENRAAVRKILKILLGKTTQSSRTSLNPTLKKSKLEVWTKKRTSPR